MTMEPITVNVPVILKGASLKSDKDGVPQLSIAIEAAGTGALKNVDFTDLASLVGKEVFLTLRDKQLRLATGN
jgi:hypothetical protein